MNCRVVLNCLQTPMGERTLAGGELDPEGAIAAIPMGWLGRPEDRRRGVVAV